MSDVLDFREALKDRLRPRVEKWMSHLPFTDSERDLFIEKAVHWLTEPTPPSPPQ